MFKLLVILFVNNNNNNNNNNNDNDNCYDYIKCYLVILLYCCCSF